MSIQNLAIVISVSTLASTAPSDFVLDWCWKSRL